MAKFRTLRCTMMEICEVAAELGTREFLEVLAFCEDTKTVIKSGRQPRLSSLSSNTFRIGGNENTEFAESTIESAESTIESAESTIESAESTIESAESTTESAESNVESVESAESAPKSTELLVHAPVAEPNLLGFETTVYGAEIGAVPTFKIATTAKRSGRPKKNPKKTKQLKQARILATKKRVYGERPVNLEELMDIFDSNPVSLEGCAGFLKRFQVAPTNNRLKPTVKIVTLAKAVKNIDVLKPVFSLVRFGGKTYLDDECMMRSLHFIAKATLSKVIPVYTTIIPNVSDEEKEVQLKERQRMLEMNGILAKFMGSTYVTAVNMEAEKHWCGVVVHAENDPVRIYVYDPFNAHGGVIKKHVSTLISPFISPEMKVPWATLESVEQYDGYNCGVFTLMALELHLRDIDSAPYNSKTAAVFFRYRYMAHALFA
ncbi:hypothetical protein PF004_g10611 [Phytophthora fragariae]|uniref:Ubiquitin-like protease family profile domain-containing protein n=2 Tax=Phytophthora fragariae TaxID=53985 RepID=A0A6G0P0F4_9STRA|nr:hypothetical protein PF004_g10611 [Phytophthora fragariae]